MKRPPEDPAVRLFIEQSMIVRIATCSPRGNPDIIPLWFVYHRGRVYMGTRAENPVARDLRVNPEVVLLFHAERRRTNRVLRVRGHATFISETRRLRGLFARFVWRYLLSPGGFWNIVRHVRRLPTWRRYGRERAGETGFIEVTLESAEFLGNPLKG